MKTKYTFGQWLKEWFNVYKKPYVKSWKNIRSIIKLHIPQSIKDIPLVELTSFDVQKAINKVTLSRTAVDVFDVYHGSLTMAYNLDLIPKDITRVLIKPKHTRKKGMAFTREELQDFLTKISGERLENFYKFLLYSGCRRSEGLSITWDMVDFEKGLLFIPGTKTELSKRYIPLFPDLKQLLLSIKKDGSRIFKHRASFVSQKFKDYSENHKLHDLRHTFATRCLECNISLKVVQNWLGHSRLETTASIYSHTLLPFVMSESEKLKF